MAETSDEDKSELAVNSLQKQPPQRRRGPGRRFKPGQSGNPAGRPPGRRNDATRAAEALLDGEAELLTRRAIELAKGGNPLALKLCLERILPRRRDRPIALDISWVNSLGDLVVATAQVIEATASGNLTPTEANTMLAALASARSIFEAAEAAERARKLEAERRLPFPSFRR